ncbi:MAG: TadE/TadG family type IV pilus assembly protein [Thermogutta sp.]
MAHCYVKLSHGRVKKRPGRRGGLTLELVLVLPIFLIALLAVIQFGQYFANLQELSFAARVGGEEAAIAATLPTIEGAPVPPSIVNAVDQQLLAAGITRRMIALEHNLGGNQTSLITPSTASAPPKLSSTPPGQYVRVVVVVPKSELMPNLLKLLGLHLAPPHSVSVASYIMKHEG